jgi:ABC-type Zn uptake system ZnuABC Zn-binding protein ZnuA
VVQKVTRADVVIYNNGSLEELKREIFDAQRRIVELLRGKSLLPLSTFVAMIGSLLIVGSAYFSGK